MPSIGADGRVGYRHAAWVLCGCLAVLTIIGLQATKPQALPLPRAEVKNTLFQLTVARDAAAQQRGLADHSSLAWDEAMLFPRSSDYRQQCFWMRDMQFAIDIVWLSSESRIVQILEDFEPESYPQTVCGPEGTSYALELRAGSVQRFALEQNDHVLLTLR